jgi:hypothetical protein
MIDGMPVTDLTKFRVGSPVFTLTATTKHLQHPAGTTQSIVEAYRAPDPPSSTWNAYHLLWRPLPSGNFTPSVTYTLKVE